MDRGISFEKVTHQYQANTPYASSAIKNISIDIPNESFTAIIGHTGSGKSTLVQHINALLKPTTGVVKVCGYEITPETTNKNLKELRKHIGMVFQFPEKQLFEETVLKDIMFGPLNYGISSAAAEDSAFEAMDQVHFDRDLANKSPFDLSGGQMRRVAIAGVLAMKPEILILDEPTAGLDPRGHDDIMNLAKKLNEEKHMTILLVTHDMNDVANYAKNVIVLERGMVVKTGTPKDIFSDPQWVYDKQLNLPKYPTFAQKLIDEGVTLAEMPLTLDELADLVASKIKGRDETS